jgi:hypothetical protein
MKSDNPEGALTPEKPRNLPRAILLATQAALHIKNLPRRLRATLAEIGRYVDQHKPLSSTVWPTKHDIAEAIGAHERTIYRHLADLEQMQLITRVEAPDVRNRYRTEGYYINGHIMLTPRGAELLGLAGPVTHSGPDKTAADATPPIKKLTEPSVSKNHPPTLPKTAPADLVILAEQGVSPGGIFGLMGEATAKGQRLGDILAVKGERLRGMREGGLVSYLRECIHGPTDWRGKAQALREKARPQQYANRRYTGPGGLVVRVFDGMAEVLRDGAWVENVTARHMQKVYEDIESGRLVHA